MVTSLANQQGTGVIQVPADYDYAKANCIRVRVRVICYKP